MTGSRQFLNFPLSMTTIYYKIWQTSREQFSMYVTCTARVCSFLGVRLLCDTCSVVLFPRHVLDRLPRSITRFQSSSHIFFFLFFNVSHVQTHAHAHVYTRPSSSQKEKMKKKKRAVLMHVHRVVCIPEIDYFIVRLSKYILSIPFFLLSNSVHPLRLPRLHTLTVCF